MELIICNLSNIISKHVSENFFRINIYMYNHVAFDAFYIYKNVLITLKIHIAYIYTEKYI